MAGLCSAYQGYLPDPTTVPSTYVATTQSPLAWQTANGFLSPPAPTASQAQLKHAQWPYPLADAAWALLTAAQQWRWVALISITNALQEYARQATALSSLIPYLTGNAVVTTADTVTVPATTAGDGLQTSQAAGTATTHPTVAKTLTGTGTGSIS
jgi:hypothetical protein